MLNKHGWVLTGVMGGLTHSTDATAVSGGKLVQNFGIYPKSEVATDV